MWKCPNCLQDVSEEFEFCTVCGTRRPDEAPSMPKIKCINGHEFEDADLIYCPICGVSLSPEAEVLPNTPWQCYCGHVNGEGYRFCENCGKAYKDVFAPVPPAPPAPPMPDPVPHPRPRPMPEPVEDIEGLRIPTGSDIVRKNRNK